MWVGKTVDMFDVVAQALGFGHRAVNVSGYWGGYKGNLSLKFSCGIRLYVVVLCCVV